MNTKESSDSDSVEDKTDDNTLSKTLSVTNYLDEIKKTTSKI